MNEFILTPVLSGIDAIVASFSPPASTAVKAFLRVASQIAPWARTAQPFPRVVVRLPAGPYRIEREGHGPDAKFTAHLDR